MLGVRVLEWFNMVLWFFKVLYERYLLGACVVVFLFRVLGKCSAHMLLLGLQFMVKWKVMCFALPMEVGPDSKDFSRNRLHEPGFFTGNRRDPCAESSRLKASWNPSRSRRRS